MTTPASAATPDDHLFATAIAALAGLITTIWAGAVLAALLTGGDPSRMSLTAAGQALTALPGHLASPAAAWPPPAADQLPVGPILWACTVAVAAALIAGGVLIRRALQSTRGRAASQLGVAGDAGLGRPHQLRALRLDRPAPGRVTLGRTGRALLACEPQASLAVVGPTGCGKTAGFAIPALLEWQGPVLATSVKTDLIDATLEHRRRRGRVWIYDPTNAGGKGTDTWTPLATCNTWAGAMETAAWMTEAAQARLDTLADADYWYAQARKALAPHLHAAAVDRRPISDVVRWIDTQDPIGAHAALARHIDSAADRRTWLDLERATYDTCRARLRYRPEGPPPWLDEDRSTWPTTLISQLDAAVNEEWDRTTGEIPDLLLAPLTAARALWGKEQRLKGSVYATTENVLAGWADPSVAAAALGPAGIDPAAWLAGDNTIYVVAATHDQARLRSVLTVLAQSAIRAGYDHANRNGGRLAQPCLVLLDEAGNTAPLRDLPAYASTARSHGITFVTVWQDLAQIRAIYHDRAQTVLNNHRAKLFGAGIADEATLDYVSRLIGEEPRTERNLTTDIGGARRSLSEHHTYRRVAPVDVLRRIRPNTAVLLYGSELPALLKLRPWYRDAHLRTLGKSTTSTAHGSHDAPLHR